jgi:hypothetical protein
MIILYGAQAVQLQHCHCYNVNTTSLCSDANCSRGDNLACHSNDFDVINNRRAFTCIVPFAAFILGCNCPGFKYNHTGGHENGFSAIFDSPSVHFTYNTCNDFYQGFDEAVACCNYCCGPAPQCMFTLQYTFKSPKT